jgi:hypothetical protein
MQIELRDQGWKTVRIFHFLVASVPKRKSQLVLPRILRYRRHEKSFRPDFAHGMLRSVHPHRGIHRLRQECPYFPSVFGSMRP